MVYLLHTNRSLITQCIARNILLYSVQLCTVHPMYIVLVHTVYSVRVTVVGLESTCRPICFAKDARVITSALSLMEISRANPLENRFVVRLPLAMHSLSRCMELPVARQR